MTATSPVLLDCTLRDGGYYTNWEFAPDLVAEYLRVCHTSGIDVVELGYVQFHDGTQGPFGRLPEGITADLRSVVPADAKLRFAAMVDGTALRGIDQAEAGTAMRATLAGSALPIDVIRVAVRYSALAQYTTAIAALRDAGYGVCVNLMQIDLATPAELDECLATSARLGPLESLYLADSLGSLVPARARELVERFTAAQPAPIGFHGHDNQGFALHNTLVVRDAGATWLDATMVGMGRGAGNTRTEQLLAVLGTDPGRLAEVLAFTARYFGPLLDKYRWGPSALYAMAGIQEVHPTFVQRLEESLGDDTEHKLRALDWLAQRPTAAFDAGLFADAVGHARG